MEWGCAVLGNLRAQCAVGARIWVVQVASTTHASDNVSTKQIVVDRGWAKAALPHLRMPPPLRSASTFMSPPPCHRTSNPSLLHLFTRTSLRLHAHARRPAALVVVVRAPAAGHARLAVVHVGHVAWCGWWWWLVGGGGVEVVSRWWYYSVWRCQACPGFICRLGPVCRRRGGTWFAVLRDKGVGNDASVAPLAFHASMHATPCPHLVPHPRIPRLAPGYG
jgi:hypothetical protein